MFWTEVLSEIQQRKTSGKTGGNAKHGRWWMSIELVVFCLMLVGIAIFHKHNTRIAPGGLAIILLLRMSSGLNVIHHLREEAEGIGNLLGLLVGFELLADHFRESKLPLWLPKRLRDDWTGWLQLLVLVFIGSYFLDNIAAAMIGGVIAKSVSKDGRVSVAMLVAIVAASNGGGAGSPIGDTTTTMMWIRGVPVETIVRALLPAIISFAVYAPIAAKVQQAHGPIIKDPPEGGVQIDKRRLIVVVMILVGGVIANRWWHLPAVGVWVALLLGSKIRQPHWSKIPHAVKNASFLLALVLAASLIPITGLPQPSAASTGALGFISAVFDNIPLTKLALAQGGYDWGLLAFAVGFGGSMTWFGSSAGVALAGDFPQAKDLKAWVYAGWFVPLAYVVGLGVTVILLGWHPEPLPPLHSGAAPHAHVVAPSR